MGLSFSESQRQWGSAAVELSGSGGSAAVGLSVSGAQQQQRNAYSSSDLTSSAVLRLAEGNDKSQQLRV